MQDLEADLTPKAIVGELDRHIVGQERAKRAVAVALRNRWRRRQLDEDLAREVYPKNILLVGPTGVGKTEIARRLAALARAPFLKVEASKFSEVGYHGRDVESMVRDLAEVAVRMVQQEHVREVRERSRAAARERLLEALAVAEGLGDDPSEPAFVEEGGLWRPFTPIEGSAMEGADALDEADVVERCREHEAARGELARALDAGELDARVIEVELRDKTTPTLNLMGPQGTESMGIDARALQEIWGRSPDSRMRVRKLSVAEARRTIEEEEADALVDPEAVHEEAMRRVENDGILFIDEIDKIVGTGGVGPDVSREGVQRDLLTVVEGCTVFTKYGHVRTDHVLFLAAGAFHEHKPSELIPELQGRFPVRVALGDLSEEDFARILTEPDNSLTKQYVALLSTEGVEIEFAPSGVARVAAVAFRANKETQNIGARRLHTTLELCLAELSFDAPELGGSRLCIDEAFVTERLGAAADDPELIRYRI